ncbi:MAG: S4 domain-containing protein [Armatimonadota bacterium]|nr:S4 domain-containing protein [Armatimonadota bacterium]MDR7439263.1 S4 domain-containing protein [Armatimonadota bacterium]MDR7562040.1 S4 domain-containing protein [Armatimonadota bacterium]MDR7568532.1 S4 domain-containing protein [Armatimonadota bacterium]MDR7601133.1 S4 domain-containing protein [Armatimonadota bacterium]
MRLDRFLQQSRVVRRRTLAHALCANFRVRLNGHLAKPASRVRPGDLIEIDFGTRRVVVRVREIPDRPVPPSEAARLVEILEAVRE